MRTRRRGRAGRLLGPMAVLLAVVTACGSTGTTDTPEEETTVAGDLGVVAADPVVSPAPTRLPDGTVAESPAIVEMVGDDQADLLVALLSDRRQLAVYDRTDPTAPTRIVNAPAAARSIATGPDGTVLIVTDDGVDVLDPVSGELRTIDPDTDATPTAAADWGDGVAIGTDDGAIHLLHADGTTDRTITGLGGIDRILARPDAVSVIDRVQSSIRAVDLDNNRAGPTLRAGEGVGTAVDSADGTIVATDIRDGELLVFTDDPLVLRQRFPIPDGPYAVAYDGGMGRVWVTVTGLNEVVEYDISEGIPVESRRFRTVQQPNSLVHDPRTGDLLVGSAVGAGLQRIPTRS